MKIVATEGGRILDLVPFEELRPPQGVYLPDFISAIMGRYGFPSAPDLSEATKTGAKFEGGKFIHHGESIVIKELALYSDGLICDAFNTDFAELILDDFVRWATVTFKFREPISPVRRTYTSALVVNFDKSVETGLGKLSRTCDLLSQALSEAYGWKYQYNLNRLAFNVDPQTIPHLRATNFILERRIQVSYSENRYFSIAPVKTETHKKLLEAIENEFLS
jgi:hypothetical protein